MKQLFQLDEYFWKTHFNELYDLSICFSPMEFVLLIIFNLVKSLLTMCSERQECGVANPLTNRGQLYEQ